MPILHNGELRRTTPDDVIGYLESTDGHGDRRLDCMAWDALGYTLEPQNSDGWPTWSTPGGELIHQAVPEFSTDLMATLHEVHRNGGHPREFMDDLMLHLREDETLTGTEFARVLPVAAITLCVVRYGAR
jgi:hypothetical protein